MPACWPDSDLAAAYEACSGTFEAYMIDIETNGGTEQRLLELALFCPRTGRSFSTLVQLPKDEWVSGCPQLERGCLVRGGPPCLTRAVLCSSTGLWQRLATICRRARSRMPGCPKTGMLPGPIIAAPELVDLRT